MSKPALSASLLDELQTSLAHGTVARRVETLRRVTDLFINNAISPAEYKDGIASAHKTSIALIEKELNNLLEIAQALQVVGATELKLQTAADAAAAEKTAAETKRRNRMHPKRRNSR